ncbi:MAG: hypothetical protein A2W20_04960 [Candidatus Aminicenantes bacterium RBG_16_66_30]|nr:MAG: hypothetical protein A2W20_04960 [Candidatus Aminicenantes bacterium RBG_16_66_30]
MSKRIYGLALFATVVLALTAPAPAAAQDLPFYLSDRAGGTPTSMFGTYIKKGEFVIYPFFEYYLDNNLEYSPNEFGLPLDQDFRGRYRATEGLMFLGYGLTDRLVFEVEAAMIRASLERSPDDLSGMPDKLTEKGLGDMQIQLDWMWSKELERRPGFFSYAEIVFPHHRTKYLIGTPELETKAGIGIIKGFRWGTLIARAAVEQAGGVFDLGEIAVEYYKRLSKSFAVYAGFEGTQDEIEFIAEIQLWLSDTIRLKINNGFGVTSKATDWAPEIGLMISFPKR